MMSAMKMMLVLATICCFDIGNAYDNEIDAKESAGGLARKDLNVRQKEVCNAAESGLDHIQEKEFNYLNDETAPIYKKINSHIDEKKTDLDKADYCLMLVRCKLDGALFNIKDKVKTCVENVKKTLNCGRHLALVERDDMLKKIFEALKTSDMLGSMKKIADDEYRNFKIDITNSYGNIEKLNSEIPSETHECSKIAKKYSASLVSDSENDLEGCLHSP